MFLLWRADAPELARNSIEMSREHGPHHLEDYIGKIICIYH